MVIERTEYHHGDLRNALLGATKELIRERGVRGFSVSEAARRAGVSVSAPYRHFSDREAMLAEVAAMSFASLRAAFSGLRLSENFEERAIQVAAAYGEFARADPARFESMFAGGVDKNAHPEVLDEAARVQGQLEEALAPFLAADDVTSRAAELWTLAHGIAALSSSGNLGHVIPVDEQPLLVASAARAWAAGVLATAR